MLAGSQPHWVARQAHHALAVGDRCHHHRSQYHHDCRCRHRHHRGYHDCTHAVRCHHRWSLPLAHCWRHLRVPLRQGWPRVRHRYRHLQPPPQRWEQRPAATLGTADHRQHVRQAPQPGPTWRHQVVTAGQTRVWHAPQRAMPPRMRMWTHPAAPHLPAQARPARGCAAPPGPEPSPGARTRARTPVTATSAPPLARWRVVRCRQGR